jgi:sulfatase modifying factor 1
MNTRTLIPVFAVLCAVFTFAPFSAHAETNVVLSLEQSTNELTGWQTIHTIVTNIPVTPQAFYRMRIVMTNHSPPQPPPVVPTNMALIPAGTFSMGDSFGENSDELPVHPVSVSAFYMDKYEVTKALWDEVATWAADNGYDISAASADALEANHPAHSVSWYEAVKWCNARSEKEGLTPCYTVGGAVMKAGTAIPDCNFAANGYRLPTEAEWEKAARGGLSGQRFPWGNTISHSQANYYSIWYFSYDVSPTEGYHPTYATGDEPGSSPWASYASPVGSFAANAYGLYDMAGNISEWCWDWYDASYYYASSPLSNPTGPASGSSRVMRSGNWNSFANLLRTSYRSGDYAPESDDNLILGFRCARSLVP